MWRLYIFRSVRMLLLLLSRARWRVGFPQRCLHWSLSQCLSLIFARRVNAVRALRAACTSFLMGNIWYSLSNSKNMLLSVWNDNQCEAVIHAWKRERQSLVFRVSQFLIIPLPGTCCLWQLTIFFFPEDDKHGQLQPQARPEWKRGDISQLGSMKDCLASFHRDW